MHFPDFLLNAPGQYPLFNFVDNFFTFLHKSLSNFSTIFSSIVDCIVLVYMSSLWTLFIVTLFSNKSVQTLRVAILASIDQQRAVGWFLIGHNC